MNEITASVFLFLAMSHLCSCTEDPNNYIDLHNSTLSLTEKLTPYDIVSKIVNLEIEFHLNFYLFIYLYRY